MARGNRCAGCLFRRRTPGCAAQEPARGLLPLPRPARLRRRPGQAAVLPAGEHPRIDVGPAADRRRIAQGLRHVAHHLVAYGGQGALRRFVAAEIAPRVDEWEKAEEFPRELFRRCAELGFLGLKFPERYGGQGGDHSAHRFNLKLGRCQVAGPRHVGQAPLLSRYLQQQRAWGRDAFRAMVEANPINPQRVVFELSPRLPDRAVVTCDSGSCANWYARDLKMRRDMLGSLSGGLASMGAAVPYAIAAKFAHPDRPVVALVGDGAMQMNNMAELITVAKYWQEWENKQWICAVFNNEDLNQVTWEQRAMEGDPKFEASQNIPDVPYHRFAESIGLKGIFVDREDRVAAAWEEALAADRPVVIEFKTDPDVPPLPPHIKLEQARTFASTLLQGDPDQAGIIKQSAKQVLSRILPGRK